MKKIAKILAVAGFAGCLSAAAFGGEAFDIVRVANSEGNTSTAINNSGEVLVNMQTPSTASLSLWGRVTGDTNLGLTGTNNSGAAVDGLNDVAGAGHANGSASTQAFLWSSGGSMQWLGTLGGTLSAATGVNTSREVVGMSYTAASLQHAFLWTDNGGMQDLTPSLTSAGGATATGINDSGAVVGYYYPNGASNVVGFNWTQAGGLQSFGGPGTLALAVNNSGTVVGRELTASGYKHAFSWTPSGGMVNLGTLGGDMSTALSINNKGWIVGTSLTTNTKNVLNGFLWTPSTRHAEPNEPGEVVERNTALFHAGQRLWRHRVDQHEIADDPNATHDTDGNFVGKPGHSGSGGDSHNHGYIDRRAASGRRNGSV